MSNSAAIRSVECVCGTDMEPAEQQPGQPRQMWHCPDCLSWVSLDGMTVYATCWTMDAR